MKRPIFKSVFSIEMNSFIDLKVANGFREKEYHYVLKLFDQFFIDNRIYKPVFKRKQADKWVQRLEDESNTTQYRRINQSKHFLIYLGIKGYRIFIIKDIRYIPTLFQPYIYSEKECEHYFRAVDTYIPKKGSRKLMIQYPVIFRILYCCGTRLNETLSIRKKDVDFSNGIIKLSETKNNCERFIVLGDDLKEILVEYANKVFYLLDDNDYIFTNRNGNKIDGKTVYDQHRRYLQKSNIPYIGNGAGPRIHDWRHHMAVKSFKQMIDLGMDMYVALPILSTYLGHKTIYATERYVRLTAQIYPSIEKKFRPQIEAIFGTSDNEDD